MVLNNEIEAELWQVISKNYEAENYKGAIIDSIFMLTDTIRNKTGLEGDGASLIGQAFGGDNPRIKLNKLQTDSDKDVQRGIQDILRGVYTAIRNPRSHESVVDEKETADSIIVFINYLLSLIDNSKLSFEEGEYLKRVFDPYYVKSREYSKLLVEEIPKRQRANIAISVILKRLQGDIYSLSYFIEALLKELEDKDISRLFKVISDELRTTTEEKDIRYMLNIIPGIYWDRIDKAVRMRIENILYEDYSRVFYDPSNDAFGEHGALSTWITEEHMKLFNDIHKWTRKTIEMMECDDNAIKAFIDNYSFFEKIMYANREDITFPLRHYISKGLNEDNEVIIEILMAELEWDKEHPWWRAFEEELKRHPEIKLIELPEKCR